MKKELLLIHHCGTLTSALRLDVEVHAELKRVRAHAKGLNLAPALVLYPTVNDVLREDSTFQEEVVVALQRHQRFVERAGQTRHVLQSFRRKIVNIFFERL